jgi:hypothetical protein
VTPRVARSHRQALMGAPSRPFFHDSVVLDETRDDQRRPITAHFREAW